MAEKQYDSVLSVQHLKKKLDGNGLLKTSLLMSNLVKFSVFWGRMVRGKRQRFVCWLI